MKAEHYRALIFRAVVEQDAELLNSIANQLVASEEAHSILRFKGYGSQGMMIDATARQVPQAFR